MFSNIRKLTTLLSDPVQYSLFIEGVEVSLNSFLGKEIALEFAGEIRCIHCQRSIPKTYSQGYCFPCSKKLACCDLCILKPEQCHYHLGTCREPEWGDKHCFIPHIVYLANTSGIKVGITRETQVPTRWIDQGAVQALPILRTQNRYQAGLLEVALKAWVQDKTNWRKMLSGEGEIMDLHQKRDELLSRLPVSEREGVVVEGASITQIRYPVLQYPDKIKSLSFEKTPKIRGTLLGIKGQYLLLDTGVLNMRNHTGFTVCVALPQ